MRSSTDDTDLGREDAGDRVSVKEKEKQAKVKELRRLNGLKQIMESPDGRVWMWAMLSHCGLFAVTFNGNSKDYFNIGARNAGMPILNEIQTHCMDQYVQMVKENTHV
jgi:hypothetical protein